MIDRSPAHSIDTDDQAPSPLVPPEDVTVASASPESSTEADRIAEAMVWEMARAADDRKGRDIVMLEVGQVSYLAEYFAISTGQSRAQVRAIAEEIVERVEAKFQRSPRNISGQGDASWILLDYGDIVDHVMLPDEREYYDLEAFWGHASRIDYVPELGEI